MAVDTTNCTVVALDDKGEVGGRDGESAGWRGKRRMLR